MSFHCPAEAVICQFALFKILDGYSYLLLNNLLSEFFGGSFVELGLTKARFQSGVVSPAANPALT